MFYKKDLNNYKDAFAGVTYKTLSYGDKMFFYSYGDKNFLTVITSSNELRSSSF